MNIYKNNKLNTKTNKTVDFAEYRNNIALVLLAILFVIINAVHSNPDNDAYYLSATGRWIVENKQIPTNNVFTMHSNNGIFIQQWICCLLNYYFYEYLGRLGLIILSLLSSVLFFIVYYYFTRLFCNKKETVLISICMASICLSGFYTSRPYLITLTILILESYLFEKYKREELSSVVFYLSAFTIGLIQSNYQCASLPYIAMIGFPYIAEFFAERNPNKRKSLLTTSCIAVICCLIGAIINPYGVKALTYSLRSLTEVKGLNLIAEMKSPRIYTLQGVFIVLSILVTYTYFKTSKATKTNNSDLSVLLTALLCISMAVIYIRCGILLVFVFAILLPHVLETISENKIIKMLKQILIVSFLLLGIKISLLVGSGVFYETNNDPIVYLESLQTNKEKTKIYTDMDIGSKYVWYGYHPYIDSRAEAYASFSTGNENIWAEYVSVLQGDIDLNKFVEKYNFEYFDCRKQTPMYVFLNNNENYEKMFEEKEFAFFRKNSDMEDR